MNDEEIKECCALCEYACATDDPDEVICDLKGKRPAFEKCRRFTYDLLKRMPHVATLRKTDDDWQGL